MLTNVEIEELSKRLNIPLEFVGYKDNLKYELPIKTNKSYIINLEDEDDEGNGSHWTGFQVNKYKEDYQILYMDSIGAPPPEYLKKIIKKQFNKYVNYNTKNIQSIVADTCGWYVLAWLHWINHKQYSTKNLYVDTENFLGFFDDLNHVTDHNKNEFMLKHFFRSNDPDKRVPIEPLSDSNNELLSTYKVISMDTATNNENENLE